MPKIIRCIECGHEFAARQAVSPDCPNCGSTAVVPFREFPDDPPISDAPPVPDGPPDRAIAWLQAVDIPDRSHNQSARKSLPPPITSANSSAPVQSHKKRTGFPIKGLRAIPTTVSETPIAESQEPTPAESQMKKVPMTSSTPALGTTRANDHRFETPMELGAAKLSLDTGARAQSPPNVDVQHRTSPLRRLVESPGILTIVGASIAVLIAVLAYMAGKGDDYQYDHTETVDRISGKVVKQLVRTNKSTGKTEVLYNGVWVPAGPPQMQSRPQEMVVSLSAQQLANLQGQLSVPMQGTIGTSLALDIYNGTNLELTKATIRVEVFNSSDQSILARDYAFEFLNLPGYRARPLANKTAYADAGFTLKKGERFTWFFLAAEGVLPLK